MKHIPHPSITRRHFVGGCGAVASAALLASCGDGNESATTESGSIVQHPVEAKYEPLFAQFDPSEEPEGDPEQVVWPAFVTSAPPEIKELYEFHITSGGLMRYMPCFCGCTGSGHRNNRDCYIKEVHADGSITFDSMAPT